MNVTKLMQWKNRNWGAMTTGLRSRQESSVKRPSPIWKDRNSRGALDGRNRQTGG